MYLFTFKEKLQKLHPLLYVNDSAAGDVSQGWKTSGIYLRIKKHSTPVDYNYCNTWEERQYLMARDAGWVDKYVCGVPTDWVPEHTIFNLQDGSILAKGWRAIVLQIVSLGICSIDKARKVFSVSLGETDYDKASIETKRELAGFTPFSARAELKRRGFQDYA